MQFMGVRRVACFSGKGNSVRNTTSAITRSGVTGFTLQFVGQGCANLENQNKRISSRRDNAVLPSTLDDGDGRSLGNGHRWRRAVGVTKGDGHRVAWLDGARFTMAIV
jgi:hypothetical protein